MVDLFWTFAISIFPEQIQEANCGYRLSQSSPDGGEIYWENSVVARILRSLECLGYWLEWRFKGISKSWLEHIRTRSTADLLGNQLVYSCQVCRIHRIVDLWILQTWQEYTNWLPSKSELDHRQNCGFVDSANLTSWLPSKSAIDLVLICYSQDFYIPLNLQSSQ